MILNATVHFSGKLNGFTYSTALPTTKPASPYEVVNSGRDVFGSTNVTTIKIDRKSGDVEIRVKKHDIRCLLLLLHQSIYPTQVTAPNIQKLPQSQGCSGGQGAKPQL
jgi:hypothetical protein